jgi:hypothetical protein
LLQDRPQQQISVAALGLPLGVEIPLQFGHGLLRLVRQQQHLGLIVGEIAGSGTARFRGELKRLRGQIETFAVQ